MNKAEEILNANVIGVNKDAMSKHHDFKKSVLKAMEVYAILKLAERNKESGNIYNTDGIMKRVDKTKSYSEKYLLDFMMWLQKDWQPELRIGFKPEAAKKYIEEIQSLPSQEQSEEVIITREEVDQVVEEAIDDVEKFRKTESLKEQETSEGDKTGSNEACPDCESTNLKDVDDNYTECQDCKYLFLN